VAVLHHHGRKVFFCQIFKKEGHSANECWWRYGDDDDDTQKDTKGAYGVDTNWYTDTGATHHVTGQLNKLSVHDTYQGRDQVHNASGQGMDIAHIGHSTLHTPIVLYNFVIFSMFLMLP
jgi:hypothetical protein